MKRKLHFVLLANAIVTLTLATKAQTVATFEALTLAPNSYWNGSATPLGTTFQDGNAVFKNYYDTAYGGFWSEGFAYSNKNDSTTAGYTNMYAARTGSGYNGSGKYGVGQQAALIKLTGVAQGKLVRGAYITNGTYAALSMKNGDGLAKKFGGASGNDPDWFKLTIKKYYQGQLAQDSVQFYLADYRFADNTQDYIVTNWRWVDLTPLGNVDSLKFILSSSNFNSLGMLTPAFFCIDNFTTADVPLTVKDLHSNKLLLSVYPNPAGESLQVELLTELTRKALIEVIDLTGKTIRSETIQNKSTQLSISNLAPGVYTLKVTGADFNGTKLFIKR
jgi:hypothetical protein